MKLIILTTFLFLFQATSGQHILQLNIKSSEDNTPLPGATAVIASIGKSHVADSNGVVYFKELPKGTYAVKISHVGFEETEITIAVPDSLMVEVLLQPEEEHEEEVIISTTRLSRSISDIPTRVETISGEELTEKSNMKPGDIRMLLNESTGIQTQQTSATSYNSAIRIQGLDGRYTQILRDGFPLYAGFSGGLSLMQIAPLDLKQVEVIKGSASTLYGGGAISGLVNLISKTPTDNRELSFLANATSARGLDLSGFYSKRYGTTGITAFASRNTGSPYDPAKIGLTAIPKFERYTVNPRLFVYGNKTNANINFSYITENRVGGSMQYIKNNVPGYFESNDTKRFTTQVDVEHQLAENQKLEFKNSISTFNRRIVIPQYIFEGVQNSSFSELTFLTHSERSTWITGINFITDDFDEKKHTSNALRNYHYNTIGAFVQNTWSPSGIFTLETGLRGDYVKQFGFELLPRFSAMLKISPELTARLGGGFGYKTPTLFNEESERIQFQNILPVNESLVENERSAGANLDFNYRTQIGDVGFALNHLFFYTRINKPLILSNNSGAMEFTNAVGNISSKGIETNVRLSYGAFKYFLGYTYADVNRNFNGVKTDMPLSARHRLNNVLMFEKEDNIKIGLEAYYFGPQLLSDGTSGKSYWITGFMAEKLWERFSVFINFENFLDTRQTKFDSIYTGSINNPVFKDIYAPLDGFVVNGGVKIRL